MSTSSPHKAVTLKIHEWLAVALLIAILGALSVMAYITKGSIGEQDRAMPAFLSKSGKIEVLIEGSVVNPGTYYLPSGIAMKDVLMLAQLSPNADLRRFSVNALLKKGRVINVPSRSMITVNLKGAVENPGKISVPKGTRLIDLKGLIQLRENADSKALNRKRKLKDGETLIISR